MDPGARPQGEGGRHECGDLSEEEKCKEGKESTLSVRNFTMVTFAAQPNIFWGDFLNKKL